MVELYHFWSSVCSVRVRMALEEKKVTWQSRYIDLFAFDQMTPDYLAINADGVVPTLVHNGQGDLRIVGHQRIHRGRIRRPATGAGRSAEGSAHA